MWTHDVEQPLGINVDAFQALFCADSTASSSAANLTLSRKAANRDAPKSALQLDMRRSNNISIALSSLLKCVVQYSMVHSG